MAFSFLQLGAGLQLMWRGGYAVPSCKMFILYLILPPFSRDLASVLFPFIPGPR
ncbi:MAG: hypothetical protein JSR69_10525 [Proteobacteria bacterium]|nr:hypothetical protein [Pseudomonadota bacterium]